MKRNDPQSLRQIIDHVINTSIGRQDYMEQRASALWPEVVGQGINRYTTRRYVKNGVLHVYISSAVIKSDLSMSKSRIIENINSQLGTDVVRELAIH